MKYILTIFISINLFTSLLGATSVVKISSDNPTALANKVKENRDNFLKYRKSKNFTGIELIIAKSTTHSGIQSIFGHIDLHFLDDDDDLLNDLVIQMVMFPINDTDTFDKALNGGWEPIPEVTNFRNAIYDFMRVSKRGLTQIVIPSNTELLNNLLNLIEQTMFVPDLLGDYKFLENNCLDLTLKLLSGAGYPVFTTSKYRVPEWSNNYFKTSMISIYPTNTILNQAYELYKVARDKFDSRNFLKKFYKNNINYIRTSEFKNWISSLSDNEIKSLYKFWPSEWLEKKMLIVSEYMNRNLNLTSIFEIVNYRKYPKSFYKLCSETDIHCREIRVNDIVSNLSAEQVNKMIRFDLKARLLSEKNRAKEVDDQELFDLLDINNPIYKDFIQLEKELKITTQ